MKIISNRINRTGSRPVCIETAAARALDGSALSEGQLETIESGLNNSHTAIGRLLETLASKGIISAPEIIEVLYGSHDPEATFEP